MAPATLGYKLKVFLAFTVAYAFFYIYPNLMPLRKPELLSLTVWEQQIPLLPWTSLIYLSDYLLALWAVLSLKSRDSFNSYSRLCFAGLGVCGLFFYVFPTAYPRPIYPSIENPVVFFAMNLIGTADTPNNCFPSMHVAMAAIAAWSLRSLGPRCFLLGSLWGLAIFVSTLTTKQHYFVDILGGLAVAGVVTYLEALLITKRVTLPFVSPRR